MVDEMNEMDCGQKEVTQNMNKEMWTEGNEIKHEQQSWLCNIPVFEFNNFTNRSKRNLHFFLFVYFLYEITQFVQLADFQQTYQISSCQMY